MQGQRGGGGKQVKPPRCARVIVIVIVMVAGARIHHETHSNDAADGVYSMANGCPLLVVSLLLL